jgi:tellurium resistance protein TerD
MSQSLTAGANVLLTRNGAPAELDVFVDWDFVGSEFYIDVNALACDRSGRSLGDAHFVYFNNLSSPCGGVTLQPDGAATNGERERLSIDLGLLSQAIDRIVFSAVVYESAKSGKSFKDVSSMGIRAQHGSMVLVKYQLEPSTESMTAVILAELYRNNGEWKFRAVGQGYRGGLQALAADYGLHL